MGKTQYCPGKTKRIHICMEDANKLAEWFNIEEHTLPAFQPIFHRSVEVLECVFDRYPDLLEEFVRQWAIDETGASYLREESG